MKTHASEILLIEDDPVDAELVARALDEYDYADAIYHVRDGEEALNYLFCRRLYAYRNHLTHPKLILLDLKLPKMSGLDVLREIKSSDQIKKIPVVVFTSSKEEQDLIESYDLGVNSYVLKPVEYQQFAQAICEVGLYWMRRNTFSA